jgi:hypothetical protein
MPVAQAWDPSYSWYAEIKRILGKWFVRPYLKKAITKKG